MFVYPSLYVVLHRLPSHESGLYISGLHNSGDWLHVHT